MKKTLLLLVAFLSFWNIAMSQTVENGVLKSWSDASGAIKIPDEVVEIAANCFCIINSGGWDDEPESNINITSVDLNNVKKIGKQAFMGCTGIESITANNVEEIGESAFEGCENIRSVALPVITTFGKTAFANCSELASVSLGNTLTTTTGNPFRNCTMLTSLSMSDGGTTYEVLDNALLRKADATLVMVAGGATEVNIAAEKCTAVDEEAMYGCERLRSIELPGVITIGNKALTNCRTLNKLIVPHLQSVNDDSFVTWQGVGQLTMVDIHLSDNFDSFGYTFNDNAQTTIYVANETIKAKLEKQYKKCTIVVGAPSATQTYKITFDGTPGYGKLEAWTTGGVDVTSGQEMTENTMVRVKATPFYGYKIEKWTVNGTDLTEELPSEGTNGQIYTINAIKENTDIFVTFAKQPEGYTIFFKSRMPEYGTLTCKTDADVEVKYGDIVPVDCQLIFTATPREGYRITDWFKEQNAETGSTWITLPDQYGKSTYTCAPEDALDIQVSFERNLNTYVVKYESLNEYATITATANDKEFTSGAALDEGAKVVFTAHPLEGYVVDSWVDVINDYEIIPGETGLTFTVDSLHTDIHVALVCTEKIDEPEDKPIVEDDHLVSWFTAKGDIVVPDTIAYIDPLAFKGAINLKSVMITKNVKSIGERAFLYCSSLTKITVDPANPYFTEVDGVVYNKEKTRVIAYPLGSKPTNYEVLETTTSIQPGAFATAIFLEKLSVPASNTALKAVAGALYTADGKELLCFPIADAELKDVELPEGVTRIARLALVYSPLIKTVKLPASLTEVAPLGLAYNAALTTFGWDDTIVPALEVIGDSAFYYNRSLERLPYCPALTTIGKAAFGICSMLKEVHIPKSCTTISKNAFEKCEAIQSVYAYAETPLVIDANTFTDIVYLNEATLYTPEGCAEKYKATIGWNVFGNYDASLLTAIEGINANDNTTFDVYTLSGVKVRKATHTLKGLAKGIYIVGNKKVVVK